MKKSYKKISVWLLGVFLTAGMLFGCGKEEESEIAQESVSGDMLQEEDMQDTQEEEGTESVLEEGEEETQKMFSFRDVYGTTYEVVLNEEALLHDYDMEYLHSDGIFKTYNAPGYTSRVGIDVSKFQGDIDWQKVKEQGIEFAFVRVGNRGYGKEGTLNTDGRYRQNIDGAKAAGIPTGVYF